MKARVIDKRIKEMEEEYEKVVDVIHNIKNEKSLKNISAAIKQAINCVCDKNGQISEVFLNNFKYKNKVNIRNIHLHIAYALSILTLQKVVLRGDFEFFDDIVEEYMDAIISCPTEKRKCIINSLDDIMSSFIATNKAYVWEKLTPGEIYIDEYPQAIGGLMFVYMFVFYLWRNKKIDDTRILNICKAVAEDIVPTKICDEIDNFRIILTPFQIAAFRILIDFMKQVSDGPFNCAEKAKEFLELLSYDEAVNSFTLTEKAENIKDEDIISIFKIYNAAIDSHYKGYIEDISQYLETATGKEMQPEIIQNVIFNVELISMKLSNRILIVGMYFNTETEKDSIRASLGEEIERRQRTIEKINGDLDKKQDFVRQLKKTNAELEKSLDECKREKGTDYENIISELKNELAEEKKKSADVAKECENRLRKTDKMQSRIASLEEQLEIVKKENEKLSEKLTQREGEIHSQQSNSEENAIFTDENLSIAKKCKYIFFLPDAFETAKLQKLFTNSSFLDARKLSNFDVSRDTEKVFVCTKGLKRLSIERIREQCKNNGIECKIIMTYKADTLFSYGVAEYKSKNI